MRYYRKNFPATSTSSTPAEKAAAVREAGTFSCFMVGKKLFDVFHLNVDGTPMTKVCAGCVCSKKAHLVDHIAAHLGSTALYQEEARRLVDEHLAAAAE